MNTQSSKPQLILTLTLTFLVPVVVAGVAVTRRLRQEAKLPKVISKVKDLEVMGVSIVREGEATSALAIKIRNTSDKPVVAFSVESGDERDASGIDINGDISDDQAVAVIEPHGTRTVELPLSDIHPGKPVKVGGAIYAGGSEDGDAAILNSMHEHRKRDKAETLKRKGGSK